MQGLLARVAEVAVWQLKAAIYRVNDALLTVSITLIVPAVESTAGRMIG